jgi:hypothetical protein
LIFSTVLALHLALLWAVIRADRSPRVAAPSATDALMLLILPERADMAARVVASVRRPSRAGSAIPSVATPAPTGPRESTTVPAPATAPAPIDWEEEARLAARDSIAHADRENAHRDLSSLSPEQLDWVRRNHLEPAAPGIPWKYRRVEVGAGGWPIIHINDHCVFVPFLMMMVFCSIGHIEARGDLFDHMRDAGGHP